MAGIVSFASIFVSPVLDIPAMERVFRAIKKGTVRADDNEACNFIKKEVGSVANEAHNSIKNNVNCEEKTVTEHERILLTDMTKPKKGEKLENLCGCLSYIDFFLANEDEAAMLTDCRDPFENANRIVSSGAGCAVIKRGKNGCIIRKQEETFEIPAYPGCKVVDTTGAGDSFAAGFLYGLSRGFSVQDCGRFACAVASCVVEEVGGSQLLDSLGEPMRRFEQIRLL